MRRIKILNRGLSVAQTKKLKALAAEAGFHTEEIVVVSSVGEPDPVCDDEIILIHASSSVCTDADLESELAAVQRGGRRAICIWPESADEAPAEPSDAMKKYAYSIIRFDAERLSVVAADDDELCFEAPTGEPLPVPETERNLCVDEKAKPA
jgi:hypothetical protein